MKSHMAIKIKSMIKIKTGRAETTEDGLYLTHLRRASTGAGFWRDVGTGG